MGWLCGRVVWAVACWLAVPWSAFAQPPTGQAAVSAWATGGTSTTAQPGDKDGKPGVGPSGAAVPYWQVPALPSAVIQGGAIPAGWQPQAVPYQGIGPDGRPLTMYFAPTYVFTYQSGPPVPALPTVNRRAPAPASPATYPAGYQPQPAWGGGPLPAPTVARYQPTPYQFPPGSRELGGTPIVPPAGAPPAPPPPPQGWGAAPATQPPQQWIPSNAPPTPGLAPSIDAGPSSAGNWAPAAVPGAAGAAAFAGAAAAAPPSPDAASLTPPLAPLGPQSPSSSATPAQPVSSSGSAPVSPASRAANSHLWRVVGVHDGDTVTCLDEANQQQKIRLAEIDAPEKTQDFGQVSRDALASMVFGKTVEVVDEGRDRYGRWIGHLYVDGVDVNRQMVATGNAWHYAAYSQDQSLAALQSQAQAQQLGLWAQPNPVPPWEYRANGGNQ